MSPICVPCSTMFCSVFCACSALNSGPFGARLLRQTTSSSVLTYDRPKETIRITIHTRTNFTGSTRTERRTARSASNAKAAMPLSTLRPSTAGKCRPKRLSTTVQLAALWTRGHASTASCCGRRSSREATPAAGRRSRPAATPERRPLLRRDGRRTYPAGRPCFEHCSARPRALFHAIGTRKPVERAPNTPRVRNTYRAQPSNIGLPPDTRFLRRMYVAHAHTSGRGC